MKIVVYLIGSLGDTLAALPALWALRHHYPQDQLILVTDRQLDGSRVGPREILDGAGLLDEIVEYPSFEASGKRLQKASGVLMLWKMIRKMKPDLFVYLLRGARNQGRIRRDLMFFRSAGISSLIGIEGMPEKDPPRIEPGIRLPSQADQYLFRLSAAGIPTPPPGQGRCDLALSSKDEAAFQNWSSKQAPDGDRPWVAFAPGSKMPSKLWPEERFQEVGKKLIESHDIWPVVFGGAEDGPAGKRLIQAWGRGALAAGFLGIRAAAVGLSRCALYVGNDTGTMHLAASAGTRCAALFSSRDFPGLWDPYGNGHEIFRSDLPCAGCLGIVCPRGDNRCLSMISADQVASACRRMLDENGISKRMES